jgi:hypothetical protein
MLAGPKIDTLPTMRVRIFLLAFVLAFPAPATAQVTLQLQVAGLEQSVVVAATVQSVNPESSRTETVVQRSDIAREPDADRRGSLAMITNNVPGAFVMHDHLHSRGRHGVSW